jgi:integration host factor subunit beta
MNKTEIISSLVAHNSRMPHHDIVMSVNILIDTMIDALEHGKRIEIRGFGTFSLHYRREKIGRNPKTGEQTLISAKHVPCFKPGKELRVRVNDKYHSSVSA